jgi:hypothetical protein
MKLPLLTAIAALASVASAQTFEQVGEDLYRTNIPIEDLGTLHLASGVITPPSTLTPRVIPGVAYDNTCWPYAVPPCNTVFINSVLAGQTRVDDGRMPSTTSLAPNVGTMNAYRITSFQITYYTNEDDPSIGGPGARINVLFWEDLDRCTNLSAAPAPTASFALTLPGTLTTGTLRGVIININLAGGFEFTMMADADGVYDGTQQLDNFAYGFNVTTVTAGKTNYIVRAGQVPPNNGACGIGDGTYYLNPGTPSGTGLDNDNTYWLQSSPTSGTCFAGAASNTACAAPQNGPVYGGFHMEITADLTDCNTNGLPDYDDILSGTSLDNNANGIPDECEMTCTIADICDPALPDVTDGCTPDVSWVGIPDVTQCNTVGASDFIVTWGFMSENKNANVVISHAAPVSAPWSTESSRCFSTPYSRTGQQDTGDVNSFVTCGGQLVLDVENYLQTGSPVVTPAAAGDDYVVQGWYRDPSSSKTTQMTDAVHFTVCP